jgi:hypothetical protein
MMMVTTIRIPEGTVNTTTTTAAANGTTNGKPPVPGALYKPPTIVPHGTRVEEGHENYMLLYDMLSGIRTCVSRTQARIGRDLVDSDFDSKHKFSFDALGTELTPAAKYDFKFKDYAPWVFRHLRNKFGIDPGDYLMSLVSLYISHHAHVSVC